MTISNAEFARRLKNLRREKRMTQSELAKRLRVSRTCITNWERGQRFPEYPYITGMAEMFRVPIDYFYGTSDHKYNINIPKYLEIDLSKLNGAGMDRMREYYEFLVKDEKFCR